MTSSAPLVPKTTPPTAAAADSTAENSNPYAVIVDRNIFRLTTPPPPPAAVVKPVELPKVSLNGIVKIGNNVRVLFSIPSKDGKAPTTYFKLAPGEKDSDLELVKIHPNGQEVDIVVDNTPMTLSMASNNPSTGPSAPGPAPAAASIPANGSSSIVIGGRNSSSSGGGVTVAGGGGSGVTVIGSSSGSSPFGGVTVAGGGGDNNNFGGGAGNPPGQIANSLFSGTQTANQLANIAPAHVASLEQQTANIIIANALGNGPPMPPPVSQVAQSLGAGPPGPPPPP